MIKKFLDRFKKGMEPREEGESNIEESITIEQDTIEINNVQINGDNQTIDSIESEVEILNSVEIECEKETEIEYKTEEISEELNNNEELLKSDKEHTNEKILEVQQDKDNKEECEQQNQVDEEFILNAKIKRGKAIKAIDIYTDEEIIFKTHKECSRKLKVPQGYIVENLKYGYMDYLGAAIGYLNKELQINEEYNCLENAKSPSEKLNELNNKIFTAKISEEKRDEILCSDKIEPIRMHYRFESIDGEYDEYFEKYKSIIRRGGKKKIELIDKNGEVVDIFKSLEQCATYLNKDKQEITDMLKYKDTKVGRYEIRYSLRNI